MKTVKIHPSLLSADFGHLKKALEEVECCADGLHCDVMDGRFVHDITFGPIIIKAIRELTSIPLYVHLMIESPEQHIDAFANAGACEITVHTESCVHLYSTIQQIKGYGLAAGVALNPATPVCMLDNVINDVDTVLVMTVEPGAGGQKFIETMLPKIEAVRNMAEDARREIDVAVDGGIDPDTARRAVASGANVLVAGSDIYADKIPPTQACMQLKDAVSDYISKSGGAGL